jgi:hypothetical protein
VRLHVALGLSNGLAFTCGAALPQLARQTNSGTRRVPLSGASGQAELCGGPVR